MHVRPLAVYFDINSPVFTFPSTPISCRDRVLYASSVQRALTSACLCSYSQTSRDCRGSGKKLGIIKINVHFYATCRYIASLIYSKYVWFSPSLYSYSRRFNTAGFRKMRGSKDKTDSILLWRYNNLLMRCRRWKVMKMSNIHRKGYSFLFSFWHLHVLVKCILCPEGREFEPRL